MKVQLKGRIAHTKYPETLQTLLKFGYIFVDVYENPKRIITKESLDNTIIDFMTELNISAKKDSD